MAIPPSLHSHGAGHSANPVCSWDSSSPPPNLTRPPHRDRLRRQVSATTGIPDLDSVSFCTFLPRYLSGLLGQANSFRPMLHPTCPPAMDVSPSSLRLLFPAPLCSEAWNLNFLHFPIYTLLVYFFFFLADSTSIGNIYLFILLWRLSTCPSRYLDSVPRFLFRNPFTTTVTMSTEGEKSAETAGRPEEPPRSSVDLPQTLDGAADTLPSASSSSHPYSDRKGSLDRRRSLQSKRWQNRESKESDIHLEDLEAFPRAVSETSARRDSQPISRRVSIFARTAAIVPKSEQRGLLARFTIIPEIESPYEYTNKTKWIITAVVAMAAAGAPMGSGIFYRK